jgi:uncharacterized protein DUF4194
MSSMDIAETGGPALSRVLIGLMKGVVYQEHDAAFWQDLLALQARVRDNVAVLGLELMLDDSEGYAFLRTRPVAEGEPEFPRLVQRRALSFPVSLLLALLRKKLAEHDASGSDTRLILSREQIVEMMRVFLPAGSNETRLFDQVDANLNKIAEMGFAHRMKSQSASQEERIEVRRILKAFVDAQWLAEFDQRLAVYRAHLASRESEASE